MSHTNLINYESRETVNDLPLVASNGVRSHHIGWSDCGPVERVQGVNGPKLERIVGEDDERLRVDGVRVGNGESICEVLSEYNVANVYLVNWRPVVQLDVL